LCVELKEKAAVCAIALAREGVTVLSIKPGPTRTAMTAAMPKSEKFADVDSVAESIVSAIDSAKTFSTSRSSGNPSCSSSATSRANLQKIKSVIFLNL
jgi:NAD(P)-dependent dehydrogenase (short-subunit alcohol dehydrogenase family)